MSPLAAPVLALLESERDYPPMSLSKVAYCLKVTGAAPHETTVDQVKIERVHRRDGERYRLIQTARPVAARGTDRPLPPNINRPEIVRAQGNVAGRS